MLLKTKQKIRLASLAYYPIHWLRSLLGKTDVGIFQRNGLKWELDLGEVVDFMIYVSGSFERGVHQFVKHNIRDGDIAFDIGANVGVHTLFMGRSVGERGRTYAVEATEYAYRKLQRNLSLNPKIQDSVEAFHCMLIAALPEAGSPAPTIEIHSSWPFDSNDERHPQHQGTLKSIGDAEQTTLDALAEQLQLERLDFVKLDVDGNEWDVLTGGLETFKRFKPLIAMEVALDYNDADDEKSFHNIHRILTELGYIFYDYSGKKLPATVEGIDAILPAGASLNAICHVPGTREPVF